MVSLHLRRHQSEITLGLVVIYLCRVEVVKRQIYLCQTHIEGYVLLLGQAERVDKKEGTSVPLGSTWYVVHLDIGVGKVGASLRQRLLYIAMEQESVRLGVHIESLFGFAVEVVVACSLQLKGVSHKGVEPFGAAHLVFIVVATVLPAYKVDDILHDSIGFLGMVGQPIVARQAHPILLQA